MRNIGLITLVILLSFVLVSFWDFWQFTRPKKYTTGKTPSDYGPEYESVFFKSQDGLKLSGWYIPKKGQETNESEPTIILVHGYATDKSSLLDFVPFLHKSYNLLLFDLRYSGESEGELTSFGFHEQKDVRASVEFLKSRGVKKIGILSFSMGAAAILLASQSLSGVSAVIADSPFASFDLMIRQIYKDYFVLKYPIYFLAKIFGKVSIGVGTNQISPELTVSKLVPILLIHSQKDELITVDHYNRLKSILTENTKTQFWLVTDAPHGAIYSLHKEEYQKKVLEFLDNNL